MANLSELAGIDKLFGVSDGRDTAIIENDQIPDFGFADGSDHFLGVGSIESKGFFAHDMFAGAGGSESNFCVRNVRSTNVDDVDQRGFNHFLPIRGGELPAELAPGGLDASTIATADRVHFDFGFEGEEMRGLAPGVRMGLAHEAVTDHSDS